MAKQIFINLAVKDLKKSMDFYSALGFSNNPQFSDDTGKCMVWSENILVMIMTHEKFKTFATKPIAVSSINFQSSIPVFFPLVPTTKLMNLFPFLSTAIHIQQ